MLDKHSNAKVVVISENKAERLGLFNENLEQVYVDGKPVDVEIINTNTLEWNLPNVVIKANAYLEALNKKDGSEKYINVFSNKFQNLERISKHNLIKVLATEKTNEFLEDEHYHHKQAIEQFNFLIPFKNEGEKTDWRKEIDEYKKEIYFNETVFNEIHDTGRAFDYIKDEQMLEIKSDIVSNLQIVLISLHNEFLVLVKDKDNGHYLNEVRELIVYVKELLEKMGYDFDPIKSSVNASKVNLDVVQKQEPTKVAPQNNVIYDTTTKKVDQIPEAKQNMYPVTQQDAKKEVVLNNEIEKMEDSHLLKKELHAPSDERYLNKFVKFDFGNDIKTDFKPSWKPEEFYGLKSNAVLDAKEKVDPSKQVSKGK